jgi:hypothetical protein
VRFDVLTAVNMDKSVRFEVLTTVTTEITV